MRTTESIRKEVWQEVFDKMKLYTMWRPEMIEKIAKEYAKEVIDALCEKVGYYEDGDIICSGNSEFCAYVVKERLEEFKNNLI